MGIHQIQIRHDELEDRLLLRMSTTDECEYRFWLTRRFVKRLWGLLVRMAGWDEALRQQFDDDARRAVLEIQHEGFAQQADYSKGFDSASRRLPLGETPVLLAKATGNKGKDGVQVISLRPHQGQGADMVLDAKLFHIFIRLLRQSVAKADWDMSLVLYEGKEQPASAQAALARKPN